MKRDERSIAEKFLEKCERPSAGECWPWRATKQNGGYGLFYVHRGPGGRVGAHRIAYELYWGDIPPGLDVCHSCDNPGCVNPLHLFVATARENMEDMAAKCRGVRSTSGRLYGARKAHGRKKWASVCSTGGLHYLGMFKSEEEASFVASSYKKKILACGSLLGNNARA